MLRVNNHDCKLSILNIDECSSFDSFTQSRTFLSCLMDYYISRKKIPPIRLFRPICLLVFPENFLPIFLFSPIFLLDFKEFSHLPILLFNTQNCHLFGTLEYLFNQISHYYRSYFSCYFKNSIWYTTSPVYCINYFLIESVLFL